MYKFTLHFATINTAIAILFSTSIGIFTLHFATINTILDTVERTKVQQFTLHFATINTLKDIIINELHYYLHYTLLLLIR